MNITKLAIFASGYFAITAVSWGLTLDELTFGLGNEQQHYSQKGKPTALYSVADSLPTDLLPNIYAMLPEGSHVDPSLIAPERYTNIAIGEIDGNQVASASITFLNEGAGFRNALGYFVYETSNPPTRKEDIESHIILLPNASTPPQGELQAGDTIDLDVELSAGQTLAFFIVPNGWGWKGSYHHIASLGAWNTPFYSLPHLNPEGRRQDRNHNVAFLDMLNKQLVIGFEDIKRPYGDNDFNDLLFAVNIQPFTAIDGVNPNGTIDAKYTLLAQQNAATMTYSSIYPSADQYATLAYEDRWPLLGDYD